MQYLAFEFDTEKEMQEVVKKLWDQLGVTGELAVRPLANGRWRVDLAAEKELRDSTLEKLEKYRVEAGD
jgi:hypothetical protein